jgi:RNA polymerase sigma-70 factor (ECF subfamily)
LNYENIIDTIQKDYNAGLELLFKEYAEKFYGYAVDCWHFSEDEAWDIVYKTLDKLAARLPQGDFSTQGQFDSYVFTVFKSFMSKGYRTKKKEANEKTFYLPIGETTDGMVQEENLKSVGFDDEFVKEYLEDETTIGNTKLERLKVALLRLSDLDRDLLLLKAQNLSYEEIGALLNIESKNLKVQHHRAKERLLKLMENNKLLA